MLIYYKGFLRNLQIMYANMRVKMCFFKRKAEAVIFVADIVFMVEYI